MGSQRKFCVHKTGHGRSTLGSATSSKSIAEIFQTKLSSRVVIDFGSSETKMGRNQEQHDQT